MIRLVVNADDLGLHPAIDEGVFRAHEAGIVTSASLMVTGRSAAEAVARARGTRLGLGVHLTLCTGLPCASPPAAVPHLAPGGRFRRSWRELATAWLARRIPVEEIETELRAQLARARALGVEVDHLDGHQHVHVLPGVTRVVERLALEAGLPLRWPAWKPSRDWLNRADRPAALKTTLLGGLALLRPNGARKIPAAGIFEAGRLDETRLLAVLTSLGEGTHELGCHPGANVPLVPEDPAWRFAWDEELRALCSASTWALIRRRRIELTTYARC